MTLSPIWGICLSVFMAVIAFLESADPQMKLIFGDKASIIDAWLFIVLGVGSAINGVLHAIPPPPKNGATK